ncbi:hypothetical protein LCGC14_2059040, partial [marine sediment metagenome]
RHQNQTGMGEREIRYRCDTKLRGGTIMEAHALMEIL